MQVDVRKLNKGVIAAMHDACNACKGTTALTWRFKALAQLIDFAIHHDESWVEAGDALLPGDGHLSMCI